MQCHAPPQAVQENVFSAQPILAQASSSCLCGTAPTLVQTRCENPAVNLGPKGQTRKHNHLPKFNELCFQISILGKKKQKKLQIRKKSFRKFTGLDCNYCCF